MTERTISLEVLPLVYVAVDPDLMMELDNVSSYVSP